MVTKHEQENISTEKFNKNVYETLYLSYKPFIGRILFGLFLGMLGRTLLLANANLVGIWVDSFCTEPLNCKPIPVLFQNFTPADFVKLMALFTAVGFVLTGYFRISFSRLSALAISRFYDEVTLRVSRFPMSFFDKTPIGRIVTRFSSDYGNVFRLFGGPLAEFLSIVFELLIMVVLIALASPIYLIFVGVIIIANYFIYRINRDRLRFLRRDLSASRSPSIAHFAETTQGASSIRTFNKSPSFIKRFNSLDLLFLSKKLNTTRRIMFFSFQMTSLSALLLLLTGLSAIYLVKIKLISVGSVGVAFSFIALSGNTIQMFFEWLAQFEEALIGAERLDKYLRHEIEPGAKLPSYIEIPTPHPTYTQADEISLHDKTSIRENVDLEIKHLNFRYSDSTPWILKNINLRLQQGERLGIVGKTGSGKSSFIQLLFQLYSPQEGSITINNQLSQKISSTGMDLNLFREKMSFIAQDPILFRGTLKENLDMENHYSEADIFHALDQVGLREWAAHHPKKLEMPIEEMGKNLSLGERQLICMARCLLQDTPIVIMDEATSSVDPLSEEILNRATNEFFIGKTQIIIAHRLSTIEKCDKVLWLHSGEVKMLGPTSEVIPKFKEAQLSI